MATRPQRKQKETKNLEWNSTAKKIGMLKTSFMQRVGGTEGKLVPPEFTELAGKVKSLKLLLAEMIDRVKMINKSILGTCSAAFECVCVPLGLAGLLVPSDLYPSFVCTRLNFVSELPPLHNSIAILPIFCNRISKNRTDRFRCNRRLFSGERSARSFTR